MFLYFYDYEDFFWFLICGFQISLFEEIATTSKTFSAEPKHSMPPPLQIPEDMPIQLMSNSSEQNGASIVICRSITKPLSQPLKFQELEMDWRGDITKLTIPNLRRVLFLIGIQVSQLKFRLHNISLYKIMNS